jgi:hypothetical protein
MREKSGGIIESNLDVQQSIQNTSTQENKRRTGNRQKKQPQSSGSGKLFFRGKIKATPPTDRSKVFLLLLV